MKLRDLVTSPTDGRLSESRVFGILGKLAILHLLISHSTEVMANWEVCFVLTGMLVAPEILKRWIATRSATEERSDDRDRSDAGRRHRDRGGD